MKLLHQTDKSNHRSVPQKKLFVKFCNIHRKSPMLKSLFGQGWNKVKGRKECNFTKKRLQQRCFPVNIANFLVTTVLKNICVPLLLKMIKKDFFEKPPVNDHYLIDMDGQRPKIYSTWPLIGPYLQRCTQTIHRQIA